MSAKAAEATTAAADTQLTTATLPAEAEPAAERQFAPAAPTVQIQATHMLRSSTVAETMPAERVPAHPTHQRLAPAAVAELLMPAHRRLHITAAVAVAVDVQAAVVAADIKAAVDTSNR